MAKTKDFGIGVMHELSVAMAKNGWTPSQVNQLSKNDPLLKNLIEILKGTHTIERVPHFINTDNPIMPESNEGWTLYSHQNQGILDWWNFSLKIYDPYPDFAGEMRVLGNTVFDHLVVQGKGKQFPSVAVAYYLFNHPELIDDEWVEKASYMDNEFIFFGTLYQNNRGRIYTPCLRQEKGKWVVAIKLMNGNREFGPNSKIVLMVKK